jgi:hypothetical protein
MRQMITRTANGCLHVDLIGTELEVADEGCQESQRRCGRGLETGFVPINLRNEWASKRNQCFSECKVYTGEPALAQQVLPH